ncbi:MAG TPA: glucose-6-phosphate isomerase [Burkholderiaceae bacterium]|jgi:glucose-6-phosphate isomerase|nr:glucose-6-phosphate isomerase [Burkholderiaceae bacterium]
MNPTNLPEWHALEQRHRALQSIRIAELFDDDPQRAQRFSFEAASLRVDLSRNRLDSGTLRALVALARAAGVEKQRNDLLAGTAVNVTEVRPAWHTALRTAPHDAAWAARLKSERERFLDFAEQVRAGHVTGAAGLPLQTVVCIGIGGSDLGPRLVTEALGPASRPRVRFAANLDPAELAEALAGANPHTTLLLAISKSFATLETVENLQAALRWFKQQAPGLDPAAHLAAVSSYPDRARALGVDPARVFTFPDWVGGRYSLWSACGLPIAIAHGRSAFEELLLGAARLDAHFAEAPLEANLPVLLGMLGVWYVNFWRVTTRAVVPYAHRLRHLPAYLQQLEMESLGKRVDRAGAALSIDTAPVVWGEVGTNAQHSVFQFLHQGTGWVPLDIVLIDDHEDSEERRLRLVNQFALAQADALAWGDALLGDEPLPPHRATPGNRPSTLIRLPHLDPRSLGALLALHEHRAFVQAVVWNINAFDQWGVEIGKQLMARRIGGEK